MVTLFYAGILTLIGIFLAAWSMQQRLVTNPPTVLGTGDNFKLLQTSRAQSNLVEYALFFIILSALLETIGQIPTLAIGILGDIFVLARVAHAYGITRSGAISIFRLTGTVLTVLVLATQSIWALWISINWLVDNNWGF
ncbi:MAG: hypothetical protein CML87_00965 [Rhodobiaceae bacterium]|jgi:uncharacterized membrane protein YecN with MAPEG domain|nr:hypothetical protein [Rhodobiaceae bacterium]|tara:strand:- start:3923 stop:4339 length:417 start_codon:yes stop_codon:yes gene_type:complete